MTEEGQTSPETVSERQFDCVMLSEGRQSRPTVLADVFIKWVSRESGNNYYNNNDIARDGLLPQPNGLSTAY